MPSLPPRETCLQAPATTNPHQCALLPPQGSRGPGWLQVQQLYLTDPQKKCHIRCLLLCVHFLLLEQNTQS